MKKLFSYIIIFFIILTKVNGQQLPYISAINEASSYWNPASLVADNSLKIDIFARQQWIGFKGAPLNGFINIQKGFEQSHISTGGSIYFDNTGPISKKGALGSFAYHINGLLSEGSRLTGGVAIGLSNYSIDLANTSAFSGDDPLLVNAASSFTNSFGVGLQYVYTESNTAENQTSTFGLAYNQFTENNLYLGKINQKRVGHWFAHVGTKIPINDISIMPTLSLNYVDPELSNALFNFNVVYEERFWFGIGYSTVNDFHLQGGIELSNFSEYEANIKIGILANSGLIADIQNFTPGVEVFMRYQLNR